MSRDEASTYVVFNPHAGKGRGAQFITPVLDALKGPWVLEHGLTTKPGDEERLAEEAVGRGFRRVVAVGGDGTWSKVANGLLRANAEKPEGEQAVLGLIPGGTGCDFGKSLGIPRDDLARAAGIVREGVWRRVDVGRIEGRYFLNICGFGYDVAVLEHSWSVKYLEGEQLYLYCAVKQLGSYPGFAVEVEADGASLGRHDLLMLIVANARFFGGKFKIAPGADLADGQLDLLRFSNMSFWRRLDIMQRLLRGRHEASPLVSVSRSRGLRLRFLSGEPPAYETDGEWNRAKNAEIEVETVPAALRVLASAA
jgi:YegS/Rv2252/BmrU family lipid kinase